MIGDDGSAIQDSARTVRLFSGWADSAVWFSGPVPYKDTRLDPELVVDLRLWDDGFYAARKPDYDWRNPEDAARYYQAGAVLARRIAEQIGHDFQVEYDVGDKHRYVRAARPGTNAAAAAAFRTMAERADAKQTRIREVVDRAKSEGDTLYWSAHPPSHDQGSSNQTD